MANPKKNYSIWQLTIGPEWIVYGEFMMREIAHSIPGSSSLVLTSAATPDKA
jgi:hypothetical protein